MPSDMLAIINKACAASPEEMISQNFSCETMYTVRQKQISDFNIPFIDPPVI